MMEKLVEWLAGETKVLGENLLQSNFVHQKLHAARTRTRASAVGSQRLTGRVTAKAKVKISLLQAMEARRVTRV
jgi:hypothetical protein